jgi:DME family drug/metabolite transporter
MRANQRQLGILAVLGAALAFGTTGTTQQLGLPDASPTAVAAARLICGSAFLFLFASFQRATRGSLRMARRDLLIAGFGIALYQLTFFSAVDATGIAIATVTALGTAPTFSAIVAFLVLGERPAFNWYLGTAITILGIILVGSANGVDSFNLLGILYAAIAGLGFAIFNVLCRRALANGAQDIWLTATTFGVAALVSSPFLFLTDFSWLFSVKGSATILWLGLITTSVGYILFIFGLKRIPASLAATVVLAEPATATILAALIIGEPLVMQSYLGILVVALGIIYISRAKQEN